MRWFQSHRRLSAWMALLALSLQLVLAFGHVHANPSGQAAAMANASGPSHPGNGGSDDNDDYCATCAMLALLTGAQIASAPVVAPPVGLVSAEIAFAPEAARLIFPRAAFRSRAPPLS
jgi:hypothetical protein